MVCYNRIAKGAQSLLVKANLIFWQNRREAVTQSHRDLFQVSPVAIMYLGTIATFFFPFFSLFLGKPVVSRRQARSAGVYPLPRRAINLKLRQHASIRYKEDAWNN